MYFISLNFMMNLKSYYVRHNAPKLPADLGIPHSTFHTGALILPADWGIRHPTADTGIPILSTDRGFHTSPTTHVPARKDDHVEPNGDDTAQDGEDDQSDGDDIQGEDDPTEIHIIDGRYYIWPAGNS